MQCQDWVRFKAGHASLNASLNNSRIVADKCCTLSINAVKHVLNYCDWRIGHTASVAGHFPRQFYERLDHFLRHCRSKQPKQPVQVLPVMLAHPHSFPSQTSLCNETLLADAMMYSVLFESLLAITATLIEMGSELLGRKPGKDLVQMVPHEVSKCMLDDKLRSGSAGASLPTFMPTKPDRFGRRAPTCSAYRVWRPPSSSVVDEVHCSASFGCYQAPQLRVVPGTLMRVLHHPASTPG